MLKDSDKTLFWRNSQVYTGTNLPTSTMFMTEKQFYDALTQRDTETGIVVAKEVKLTDEATKMIKTILDDLHNVTFGLLQHGFFGKPPELTDWDNMMLERLEAIKNKIEEL